MANAAERRTSTKMSQTLRLLVIGAVLATVLLPSPGAHGAVIKRENSISEQELISEQFLAAAKQSSEKKDVNNIKIQVATDAANRVSNNKQQQKQEQVVVVVGDADGVATAEPLDSAAASATDTPIPTFQPSIDKHTSEYHDDGVAASESLRESDGGSLFTTVDYEQRFDRIEMTTTTRLPAVVSSSSSPSVEVQKPSGMFPQESSRFDANGVTLEKEEADDEEEAHEQATIVNLETAAPNKEKKNSTSELETTKYETQAAEEANSSNQTTPAGGAQKRGKYLQNPEQATAINSEINDTNLSLPSTADVWPLAAMKNVQLPKSRPPVAEDRSPANRESMNATTATKLMTDWMGIMTNDEFSNGSYLRNDIPSVADRPATAPDQHQLVSEVVTAAASEESQGSSSSSSSTIPSIRRFDESYETTTEQNIDRSIDLSYPTGLGGVSDNLYYEDFTTDLPDFPLTTAAAADAEQPAITTPEEEEERFHQDADQLSIAVRTATTTETTVPRNEINTVPTELSYNERKPSPTAEGIKEVESSSLSENIIPSTTAEELNRHSGTYLQNPTTPQPEEEEEPRVAVTNNNSTTTTTTEIPPRIVPLVDDGEVEQEQPHRGDAEKVVGLEHQEPADKEHNKSHQQIVESTDVVSATDITNNSIISVEKQTETKAVESNNLPEYTVVESSAADGVGGDAPTNSNHLENTNNNSSQSSANNDHEDGHEQLAHEHTDYYRPIFTTMTESTRVLPMSNSGGESSGATTPTTTTTTVSSASAVPATMTSTTMVTVSSSPATTTTTSSSVAPADETMVAKTKTTTTTTTLSPDLLLDLERRRTNGHQAGDDGALSAKNGSLELGSVIGGSNIASDTATTSQTEDDGSDVNAIIAITVSVIAVIALLLLVGFLYVMRKRQKQLSYGQRCQPVGLDAYSLDNVSVYNSVRRKNNNLRLSKRSYGNSAFEDPGLKFNNLSIQGLQTMLSNKAEIYAEFKEIPQITARVDEVPAGCEDKNRYANVVPLPETRVHLKQLHGDEKTEYINANYVRGPKDNANYYIACQAPMENTIVDFWRMIWEQNSKVVCMLTDLTENGIEKCAEYLPPSAVLDTNRDFGNYSVTLKSREVKDKYAVSTIHLRNTETNTWREITHFWYQWPEEGMPLDETSVIAMLLEVRSYLKMAMPEQAGNSDDDEAAGTQDEKQQKIQELNDELTEKLGEEDNGGGGGAVSVGEKKANGTIDKSKSLQRTQGPLTVHCSPGTGRTGTIIACDVALRSLEMKNRSVDVSQTVYYVRRGRASTIKTREQYEFIYRCANTYAQKLMEPIAEN